MRKRDIKPDGYKIPKTVYQTIDHKLEEKELVQVTHSKTGVRFLTKTWVYVDKEPDKNLKP